MASSLFFALTVGNHGSQMLAAELALCANLIVARSMEQDLLNVIFHRASPLQNVFDFKSVFSLVCSVSFATTGSQRRLQRCNLFVCMLQAPALRVGM